MRVYLILRTQLSYKGIVIGYVQVIEDEGMPYYGENRYGNLYVEYNVVLPQKLSPNIQRSEYVEGVLNRLLNVVLQN